MVHVDRPMMPHCPCCGYKYSGMVRDMVGLRFTLDERVVQVGDPGTGVFYPFTPAEALLLFELARYQGRPAPKTALYDALYPEGKTDPKIIDVYVHKVRRKLVQLKLPVLIRSYWGRGYSVAAEGGKLKASA